MTASPSRALRPGWRALRIAALGGASLLLAAVAHTVAGGSLPSAGVLVVAAFALGLIALPLTSRQVRPWVLLPVLAIEQYCLHQVFGAAAAVPGCTTSPHAHALLSCTAGEPAVGGSGPAVMMWLGHALAVLGTAWLLARGERALWRIGDQVVDRLSRATAPPRSALPAVAAQTAVLAPVRSAGHCPFTPLPPRGPPS